MIKEKKDELAGLKEEVNCPLSALSVEGGLAFCSQPVKIGGKTIDKACLGQVKEDIKTTCSGCKLKMLSENRDELTLIPIIDGCAKCPAMNTEIDLQDTCLKCPFFDKKKFKELGEASPDGQVDKIPCRYPNFPKEKVKLKGFILAKKEAEKKKKKSDAI